MIKLEFPADRPDIARALGEALVRVAAGGPVEEAPKSLADAPTLFPPEETETAPTGTAPTAGSGSDGPSVTNATVDTNGVAFDANYCGQAKDPYYATGKRSGQWKKRKGISDADYDAWYMSQLPNNTPAEQPVNTGAAFGAPPAPPAPVTTGEFMGWVSEQQAAGRLTQKDVGKAYHDCALEVTALFPPTPDGEIVASIAKLYGALNAVLK